MDTMSLPGMRCPLCGSSMYTTTEFQDIKTPDGFVVSVSVKRRELRCTVCGHWELMQGAPRKVAR